MSQRKQRQNQAKQEAQKASQQANNVDAKASASAPSPEPPPVDTAEPIAAPPPSARPVAGLTTSSFPLEGTEDSDEENTADEAVPQDEVGELQATPARPQTYRGDEIGECTVRIGAKSGAEYDIQLPIDDLGYNNSQYVVEFRREAGPSVPVALVPAVIADMLRKQGSASRNFAFGLA